MDTLLKQEVHQLIDNCEDVHQLYHIKYLIESEQQVQSIVQEPAIEYSIKEASPLNTAQVAVKKMIDELQDIEFLQSIKENLAQTVDSFDELSPEDKEDLLELINEPFGKDTISHDEFLKATERWRTN